MSRQQFSGTPGGYAKQRYDRGLRRWRAKMRRPAALILGPFILVSVYVEFQDPHWQQWMAGMAMGAAVCMWTWLRDSPPPYVENWNLGHEGEVKTAKALDRLSGPDWRIWHDIQTGRGNYDHVVIGPAGVFLLDSKNLRGQLVLEHGVPKLRRYLDPDSTPHLSTMEAQVRGCAARLQEDIRRATRFSEWVQAIIVVWADFPDEVVHNNRCKYVHGSKLAEWLDAQPTKLAPNHVELFGQAVDGLCAQVETLAS